MPQWIITPDKYLTPEEVKKLRKTCQEAAMLAKAKGVQAPVRNHDRTIRHLTGKHQKKYTSISRQRSWLLNEQNRTTP